MSNSDSNRKRRENRPTDPFGGPAKRGSTVSTVLALVVLAVFLWIQYTNGTFGDLLRESTGVPTVQPSPVVQATEEIAEDVAANDAPAQVNATQPPAPASTAESVEQARGAEAPRSTPQPTPTANAPPIARASNLPIIAYNDLPPEAHETITLIEQGGPFPFSRDGVTFQNRERILPLFREGYYREYTVITPGVSTRGARRIVTGETGEMYYTDDHYDSFREIIR